MLTVKIINKSDNKLPQYETEGAAAMDLRVSFKYTSPENPIKLIGDGEVVFKGEAHSKTMVRLEPMARAILPTDLYVELPKGYVLSLRPRSGMAIKLGVSLINTPATIDEDYRGNIGLLVINLSQETVWIEDGERICQALLEKVNKFQWQEVDALTTTDRGEGGFGHTGKK